MYSLSRHCHQFCEFMKIWCQNTLNRKRGITAHEKGKLMVGGKDDWSKLARVSISRECVSYEL